MMTRVQEYGPLLPPRSGDLTDLKCPSRQILDHLTSRWGVLVIIALLQGTHRFSVLGRRVTGVSEKMLAQTLQALEGDGFVLRTVYATVPPKVEYSLTPMGVEVATHIKRLTDWVEENVPAVMKARERVVAKKPVMAL
jgi:DNA-binding HxlR family transcriptional regulator